MGVPPSQSIRVPSCSTVPLANPSIPVQKTASDSLDPQVPLGSVQLPVILVYLPDVFVSA